MRAPLKKQPGGLGLAACRDRKVTPDRQRIHLLWKGYAHAVQPPEAFPKHPIPELDPSGNPVVSFASEEDSYYQKMLTIIQGARETALANPRVDMPGAKIIAGTCRAFNLPELHLAAAPPNVKSDSEGVVHVNVHLADAYNEQME